MALLVFNRTWAVTSHNYRDMAVNGFLATRHPNLVNISHRVKVYFHKNAQVVELSSNHNSLLATLKNR